ncbi:hypothetical protein [Streptomyces mirabilis]|uniref:hypothetical protein n=1 Tax=Streptomyces mirabilis TaxID=68239 RepID=UPI0036612AC9
MDVVLGTYEADQLLGPLGRFGEFNGVAVDAAAEDVDERAKGGKDRAPEPVPHTGGMPPGGFADAQVRFVPTWAFLVR